MPTDTNHGSPPQTRNRRLTIIDPALWAMSPTSLIRPDVGCLYRTAFLDFLRSQLGDVTDRVMLDAFYFSP
jgi:hypothetical protein